jgi:ribonuclease P protein component
MRLPSRLRLKASRDFAKVRELGQSFPGRCVVLGVQKVPEQSHFQFGLITSRKIGQAVVRNRVRRLLREVLREQQERFSSDTRVVVIARWRAAEASLDDLRSDLMRTARRAGILKA